MASNSEIYAEVALDVNIKDIYARLFTYEIPEALQAEVFIGTHVLVPFGHQELVSGFVVGLLSKEKYAKQAGNAVIKTKPISDVLDNDPLFDKNYVEFLYWISSYYMCGISEVLGAAIPAEIGPRIKRVVRLLVNTDGTNHQNNNMRLDLTNALNGLSKEENLLLNLLKNEKSELSVKALKDRSNLSSNAFYNTIAKLRRNHYLEVVRQAGKVASPKLENQVIWTGEEGQSERQKQIIACLKRNNGAMLLQELVKEGQTTPATIKRMASLGMLCLEAKESIRDPLKNLLQNNINNKKVPPDLTDYQKAALETLFQALKQCFAKTNESPEGELCPWLLHGVTGSGKTEIYLRLIQEALEQDRTALLMVPEISLTPQLAQRLLERFGEQVAIWHSAISAGERYDTWRRLQSGELKVVLGARSAILANIPKLGLIILDEEHDGSYKQSSPSPRYSAKRLALERGKREGALVLFGSATPDVATYYECKAKDKILVLPERVFKQALPASILVDMRPQFQQGNRSILSHALQNELNDCLQRKEQAILLINRRGYASHVFCRSCGHVVRCRNCSVSMVFHSAKQSEDNFSQEGRFTCHHCGYNKEATEICPSCDSPFLRRFGLGTQRVEEETRELFPEARILRLDSDITAKKGAYEEIFKQFSEGQADILIGTQIVAKGIDIANVTFVGVLAADAAFNLPDYRSLERGFQLLTQVSGRAGRGHQPGKVVLQTYNTELPALQLARAQDYLTFVEAELQTRQDFAYPPFSQLIRIVISGAENNLVQMSAEQLAEEISTYLEDLLNIESVKLLGPAPCVIERIKTLFRHQILIKNLAGDEGREAITSFLRTRQTKPNVRIAVDIDPLDLV